MSNFPFITFSLIKTPGTVDQSNRLSASCLNNYPYFRERRLGPFRESFSIPHQKPNNPIKYGTKGGNFFVCGLWLAEVIKG